jgi:parvulin-like peptidyl-prolyl isomerase
MNRPLPKRLLSLCVAIVLLVAACGGEASTSSSNATTVATTMGDGAAEPSVVLPDGIAALVDNVVVTIAELDSQLLAGAGSTDRARALRRLIINTVLEAAVAELGVAITEADLVAARTEILSEAGIPEDELLVAASLTPAAFELIVRQGALAVGVESYLAENAPPPRDEDLAELYAEEIGPRTTVCSVHILLDTGAEAQAALDRASAGEEFAALAMELSTGPSGPDGGDLGCSSPSQFVEPFAEATIAAEVGVPYGPVETQFGFHVILVTDRRIPTLDDLRDELAARLVANVFPVWLTAQITAANVAVDASIGTWIADPPDVRPAE